MSDLPDRDGWVKRVLGVSVGAPAATSDSSPLAIWRDAKDSVDAQLNQLSAKLRGLGDPFFARIADEGLGSITKRLQVGVQAALFDLDRSPGDQKAREQVKAAVGDFRSFLADEPVLPLLESNPFGVKLDLRAILSEALGDIDAALGT